VADVSSIVLPIVTGIGGVLIGAGFGRITSRTDQRRDRYSDARTASGRSYDDSGLTWPRW
jgi:hypothetical protein